MIPPKPVPSQSPPALPAWQFELRDSFRRPQELLSYLGLPADLPALDGGQPQPFGLRVPRAFAALMRAGDAQDPLFLQVWPRSAEAETADGYGTDAVGDLDQLRDGGIIHKYAGRVLLMASGACAVHCRYCFRRHFPYGEHLAMRDQWQGALKTIAADSSIHEVILSGGDPLSLSDNKLARLAEGLEFIPHLHTLRIHSRQPVVLPSRVDEQLLQWLQRSRLRKVLVLHINHAQEISPELRQACSRLRAAGVTLLNQSVLLRGINDSADQLARLSETLWSAGVLPYYLHLLDRVAGSAHFEVPLAQARTLMRDIQGRLPGYLLPRLARETAGAPAKTLLAW